MTSPILLTDGEIQANARALAGAALAHPLALQLTSETISALSAIATGDAPAPTAAERLFLRLALDTIDQAEILLSREPRP
jgi:hypothetical protein